MRAIIVTFLLCSTVAIAATPVEYKKDPGPHPVTVDEGTWIDRTRDNREVPWRLYLPGDSKDAVPVVVWSHGLGGSRNGAEYLGRHLASHGYAAFHIQHAGSDAALLAGGRASLLKSVQDSNVSVQRFLDVPFAVAQIETMQRLGPYAGRLDVERMGMSGHSFGAITTLVAAGQVIGPRAARYPVPAFDGAFAMSPSPPRNAPPKPPFADMIMPIFHLTGTRDGSPLGDDLQPIDRRTPFDTIDDVDQYLLILKDGVHMTFSGRTDQRYPALDRHHDLIRMAAVAFWDSFLKDDEDARAWLEEGGFAEALGADGTFEVKRAAR